MSSSFQEVRHRPNVQGPVSKVGNACCCSCVGILLLFPAGLCLVGWNEQRTVCVERAVLAAEQSLAVVKCDADPRRFAGDLVFASCKVNDASLEHWQPSAFGGLEKLDGLFQTQALRMQQRVEMYQCVEEKHEETEKSRDGKESRTITTYTYKLAWQDRHIDSSAFKNHKEAKDARWNGCGGSWENPQFSIRGETKNAGALMAGSFDLTRHLWSVPINQPVRLQRLESEGSWMWDASHQPPPYLEARSTMVSGDYLYTCDIHKDITQGCLRLSYKASSALHASMLAKLNGDGTSKGWQAPSSWMCSSRGSSSVVDFFVPRSVNSDEAIDELLSSNDVMKWTLRIGGLLLAWLGIHCFLQPVQALVDVARDTMGLFSFLPIIGWLLEFLGDVVTGAVGCALVTVSFGVAAPLSLLVMSAMWFVMRPALGIAMFVASLAGMYLVSGQMRRFAMLGQQRKAKNA